MLAVIGTMVFAGVLVFLLVAFTIGHRKSRQDTAETVAKFRAWERLVEARYLPLIAAARKDEGWGSARSLELCQQCADEVMSFFDREGL